MKCRILVLDEITDCRIVLSFVKSGNPRTRSGRGSETEVVHRIPITDITLMKYFIHAESLDSAFPADSESAREDDGTNFLLMTANATSTNELDMYPNAYKPETKGESPKNYVVVEFRSDRELLELRTCMQRSQWNAFFDAPGLSAVEARQYIKILEDDTKKNAAKRRSSPGQKQPKSFFAGLESDEILLVFPFAGNERSFAAASSGLLEVDGRTDSVSGTQNVSPPETQEDSMQTVSKKQGRRHFLTVRVEDYERLQPGEYLNDTLVDLWMLW